MSLLVIASLLVSTNALNFLFIAVDDLRPEIAGPFGQNFVHTPNIDRLAAQGTTFTRAYCQVAICSPSRTATLTGLRPDTSKVWKIGPYFRETMGAAGKNVVTLPQFFKEHGYNTTGAGKIFHPGKSSGGVGGEGGGDMPYSWSVPYFFCDQFYNGTFQSTKMQGYPNGSGCVQSDECISCLKAAGSLGGPTFKPSWKAAPCAASCYPDGAVADEIVTQLHTAAQSSKPFFIAAGFKRPHLGWFAPAEYFDMYDNKSIVLAEHRHPPAGMPHVAFGTNGEIAGMQDVHPIMDSSSGYPLVPDWKHYELRRAYYAAVTFMDSQLGRVLDALESTGLRNDTVVVFWGDHGYQLGERGLWTKMTNFEAATRIPLIISLPNQETAGSVSRSLVEEIDMYPTLVQAAGFSIPSTLAGKSLLPILQDPSTSVKNQSFSQFYRTVGDTQVQGLSMRVDQYRYTEWVEFDYQTATPNFEKVFGVELYDHSGDKDTDFNAFENENVFNHSQYKDVVQVLHDELRALWK
eukprot:m.4292 g.4292  ORF g.4292 m.4292 type:complete len:519 (-) comp4965_c0_seq1:67-1623(-)